MGPYKKTLYEQLARLGKALAASKRVEMLDALSQAPRTVERLAAATGQTIANASQHLRVLREAQLAELQQAREALLAEAPNVEAIDRSTLLAVCAPATRS